MRACALLCLVALSCSHLPRGGGQEPLPSWHRNAARQAILDFVRRTTDPQSVDFVPREERIAVFDNDGTLWCERPLYTQLAFVVERARSLVEEDPELATEAPFSLMAGGTDALMADPHALMDLVAKTSTGMTQAEFVALAESWFASARHPRFERPYQDLVYQPMLELLAFLRQNDFQTWICTGGGLDFVRCISDERYGIPPEQVIGTSVGKSYELVDGKTRLTRQPHIVPPLNDGPGKPVNVERFLGHVPIMAVGNSDGDLELMQYADDGHASSLCVLVHHDDAEREYAYRKGTVRALAVADERGWTVVSMARDFARVFPE